MNRSEAWALFAAHLGTALRADQMLVEFDNRFRTAPPVVEAEPFWPTLVSTFATNVDPELIHLTSNDWDDFVVNLAKEVDRRRLTTEGDFYAGDFMEAAAVHFNNHPYATKEQLLEAGQRESDALAR